MKRFLTIVTLLVLAGCSGSVDLSASVAEVVERCWFADDAQIESVITLVEADFEAGISKREELENILAACPFFPQIDVSVPDCSLCFTAIVDLVYD